VDGGIGASDDGRGVRIGTLALQKRLITPEQLREAMAEQARDAATGQAVRPLDAILLSRGFIKDRAVFDSLVKEASGVEAAQIPTVVLPGAPKALPKLGKYRIERELGRGGMGVVYEAVDEELDRRVALKMLLTSPNADAEEAALEEERFLREAKLSAKLPRHPHIVGIYEAGIADGKRYLAMELISGRQMNVWRKAGSVTVRQQVTLLRDVSLAVHHAHRQKIIHRDLKPQNILIDEKNQPHVMDFGLAKIVKQDTRMSLTASGMVMGTPAYMSPEQARGLKSIDLRTDVYALGVMLYETLTGRTPFTGETAIEILMHAVNDPVPPPSTAVRGGTGGIDKAIENICLKALAKNPEDRYASASDFAADLTKWLKGQKVTVRAAPPPRKNRVAPAWMIGGAVAAVVVVGLLVALLGGSEEAVEQARREAEAKAKVREKDLQRQLAEKSATVDRARKELADAKSEQERKKREEELSRLETEKKKTEEQLEVTRKPAPAAAVAAIAPVDILMENPPRGRGVQLVGEKDGPYALVSHAGKPCARLLHVVPGDWHFFYLNVADDWNPKKEPVEIAVEYFDGPPGSFGIQYDAADHPYRNLRSVRLKGSGAWKTARFHLENPRFAGRENGNSDFRLAADTELLVHRISVGPAPAAAPPASRSAESLRPGLAAEYFYGERFATLGLRRTDPQVAFNWGTDPAWPGGPSEVFSARWSGYLRVPESGQYRFEAVRDDFVTVLLEDRPVLDGGSGDRVSAVRTLAQGIHRIEVEYINFAAQGFVTLKWARDDGEPRDIGPESFLHDPAEAVPFAFKSETPFPGEGVAADDAWKRAVNLLRFVDPARDAVLGEWKLQMDGLASDASDGARLELPYRPPEEYDFRIVFTRLGAADNVSQMLTASGRPFSVTLGGWGNRIFSFERISGLIGNSNPSTVKHPSCLETGKRHTSLVQVRKSGCKLYVDGKLVTFWKTDFKDMSIQSVWALRDPQLLGVGSWHTPTVFHSIDLREVGGAGKALREPSTAKAPPTPAPAGQGVLLREVWTNISGNELSQLTRHADFVAEKPTRTEQVTVFEAPSNAGDDYGQRLCGYVHPPADGSYVFFICSDDASELWLSPDDNPARKARIALVPSFAEPGDWSKAPEQQSAPLELKAGRRYYIEAIHKEGLGNDHLAVGWRLPDGAIERPIPGRRLSPPPTLRKAAASSRLAEPPAAELKSADKAVDELFRQHYIRENPAMNVPLVAKLLERAFLPREEPAMRYVLYRRARDLAVEIGSAEAAFRAIDSLSQAFEVDAKAQRTAALKVLVRTASTPPAARSMTETCLRSAGEAAAADDYDGALSLLTYADAAVVKSRDPGLADACQKRRRDLLETQREFGAAKTALKTLEEKPADGAANFKAGRFLCFFKQDWEAGLPYLSKGSDTPTKAMAEKDLLGAATPDAQVALGDAWLAFAEKQGAAKPRVQERGFAWYRRAWPGLTGAAREKALARFRSAIVRPGVKEKVPSDMPPQWNYMGLVARENVGLDETVTHGGRYALKVYTPPKETEGRIEQEFKVTAGRGYRVSCWILSEGIPAYKFIEVQFFGKGRTRLNVNEHVPAPADQPWWTLVEKTVTAPPEAETAVLVISSWSLREGKYWADDVSVKAVTDGIELLRNTGFEETP
jgi:hypothetical protein